MGILSKLKSKVATALDYITAPLAKPLVTITQGISAGAAAVKEQRQTGLTISQGIKQIGVIAGTTAVIGGAVLAAAPAAATGSAGVAARSTAVSVAKAIVPKTTTGKIAAVVVAPVVAGAIAREPAKVSQTISKAPGELAQFGGDVASFVANPSLETGKQILKESPIISSAVAIGGAVALGSALLPAIGSARQTEAIKEQTEVLQDKLSLPGEIQVIDKSQGYFDSPAANNSPIPQLPKTETMKTTTTARKRRRKAPEKPLNISQKVNIAIQNKPNNLTKRYINVVSLPE